MFTGLVERVGTVLEVNPLGEGRELSFSVPEKWTLTIGESVAVNGVCSTVVACTSVQFVVQYLKESLDKTTIDSWGVGDRVNLERCLTPTTRLGGHIVTGHVDAVGELLCCEVSGPWHHVEVSFEARFAPFLIEKGSICIEGISLTVVEVKAGSFTCDIIPHTYAETVLKDRCVGDSVNVEFDVLAKYAHRFAELKHEINPSLETIITQIGQDYDKTNI